MASPSDYFKNPSNAKRCSQRNVIRMARFREYKNLVTTTILQRHIRKSLIDASDDWSVRFWAPNDNNCHPLFYDYIEHLFSSIPKSERVAAVERVIGSITTDSCMTYFYDQDSDTRQAVRETLEDTVERQEVIIHDPDSFLVEDLPRTVSDIIDLRDPEPEVATIVASREQNKDVTPEVRTAVSLATELPLSRQRVVIRKHYHEVKKNDVYSLSKAYDAKHFPFMLYAPPKSGKSTLNRKLASFLDTDSMYLWPYLPTSPAFLTNMSHMLEKAQFSVAVVPSRKKFMSRVGDIPGAVDQWYDDMLKNIVKATVIIHSDGYLSDIFSRYPWLVPVNQA